MYEISSECSSKSHDATLTDTQFSSTGGLCDIAVLKQKCFVKKSFTLNWKATQIKSMCHYHHLFIIFFSNIPLIIFAAFCHFLFIYLG